MDNAAIARLLEQTADLLEVDGADRFRVGGYRRAAEAAQQTTTDLASIAGDQARLLAIPGIGKSMANAIQAIAKTGSMPLHEELLAKYGGADLLELLKLPSMGPKTIALSGPRRRSPASISSPTRLIPGGWLSCRAWDRSSSTKFARASMTIAAAPAGSGSIRLRTPPSALNSTCWRFSESRGHAGGLSAARPRDGRRSRHAGDRPGMRAGQHRSHG